VHEHRARLVELDSLLEQLEESARPELEVEVDAARDVLHDAIYGAFIDAGERIAVACDASWRREPVEKVRGLADELVKLEALLRRVEGTG
jgi:hypothetical protein